ncbi:sigma-70 family RNA polymerase sigma factor [Kitasatospora sp. NPDC094015]|uniref:sigma-70 family RNA polymerase sigma factor n=1 Tax=Kitasatospora sp. NPDC094015 TaxID=3155205 RepID=UPI0033342D86
MIPVAALRPALLPFLAALARGSGADPDDLEQSVWLTALERAEAGRLPATPAPAAWLRGLAVREALAARAAPAETPVPTVTQRHLGPAEHHSRTELHRALRRALAALPGRCPELLAALAGSPELTYQQLAGRLGLPRGSLGPTRSRCLGCLRVLLAARREDWRAGEG